MKYDQAQHYDHTAGGILGSDTKMFCEVQNQIQHMFDSFLTLTPASWMFGHPGGHNVMPGVERLLLVQWFWREKAEQTEPE